MEPAKPAPQPKQRPAGKALRNQRSKSRQRSTSRPRSQSKVRFDNKPKNQRNRQRNTNVPRVQLSVGDNSGSGPSEADKFTLARLTPGIQANYVHDNTVLPWECSVIRGTYYTGVPASTTLGNVDTFLYSPVVGSAYGLSGFTNVGNLVPSVNGIAMASVTGSIPQVGIYGSTPSIAGFYTSRFFWSSAITLNITAPSAIVGGLAFVSFVPAGMITSATYSVANLMRIAHRIPLTNSRTVTGKVSVINTHLIYHQASGTLDTNPDLSSETVMVIMLQNVAQNITTGASAAYAIDVEFVTNVATIPDQNPASLALMMRPPGQSGVRRLTNGVDVDMNTLSSYTTTSSWTDTLGRVASWAGDLISNNAASWTNNFNKLVTNLPLFAKLSGMGTSGTGQQMAKLFRSPISATDDAAFYRQLVLANSAAMARSDTAYEGINQAIILLLSGSPNDGPAFLNRDPSRLSDTSSGDSD